MTTPICGRVKGDGITFTSFGTSNLVSNTATLTNEHYEKKIGVLR